MRKINLRVLLIAMMFIVSACSSDAVKEPQDIGKEVFEVLKGLSSSSDNEYSANFMSVEEIRELGENEEVVKSAKVRKEMISLTNEEWSGKLNGDYNRIKEKGVKLGINWSEIHYSDFIYEVQEIEGCIGTLYFKFNNSLFKVNTGSLFDGNGYRLIEIRSLRKQD